jgi:hypothetical protein
VGEDEAGIPRIAERGDPKTTRGLIPAELEHVPAVVLDQRAGHLGEASGEVCGLLIPPFLRERRVPTDVGNQERVDVRVSAGVRLRSWTARRLAHRGRLLIGWNHPASMDPSHSAGNDVAFASEQHPHEKTVTTSESRV